jgi:hypothetical protein
MHQLFSLTVPGANTHTLRLSHLESLQAIIVGLGAEAYPLVVRLGGSPKAQVQPVTSRALLAELEHFLPLLAKVAMPCLVFRDADGRLLGGMYGPPEERPRTLTDHDMSLAPTTDGIRMVLRQMPPPMGFRSSADLPAGVYECYFRQVMHGPEGYMGVRTEAMGGSGAPVPLPDLELPPITRWDFAHTSGKPVVDQVEFVNVPAPEAFKDVLHSLESAFTESLRLKLPLRMRKD